MSLSSHSLVTQIVTLDIQRRHLKACSKYGTSEECPSASKKKCPYRLFGIGINQHGKRQKIRKTLGTNNLQIATEMLQDYRLNVESLNKAMEPTSAVPLEKSIAKFFEEESGRGVSDSTLNSFHKFLDRKRDPVKFSPTLVMYAEANKITTLSEITPDHLKAWRAQWKLGTKSSTKQWERVRQFFKHAHDSGWITANPAAKIKSFVASRDDLPVTALSSDEVKAVLNACGNDEYARTFLLTMLHSGVAMVDAVQLKPDRLEGQHLTTYRTKTGKRVKVKLPPYLVQRLEALPVQEGGYWFWNRIGGESKHQTATGNMRRYLRPLLRKSGILIRDKQGNPIPMLDPETGNVKRDKDGSILYKAVHPHQFRHTFVHRHLLQGTPIETVATLIGDTVRVVSTTYAHFIEERQQQMDKHTESTWDLVSV